MVAFVLALSPVNKGNAQARSFSGSIASSNRSKICFARVVSLSSCAFGELQLRHVSTPTTMARANAASVSHNRGFAAIRLVLLIILQNCLTRVEI